MTRLPSNAIFNQADNLRFLKDLPNQAGEALQVAEPLVSDYVTGGGLSQASQSQQQAQPQGLQANAVAFNEDEAAVLAQMMGAGVLSGAAVGALQQTHPNISSLNLDQSLTEHHLFSRLPWVNNRIERNHFNRYYADPKSPIDLWQRTAQKHGMELFGTDGQALNPKIRNVWTDFPPLEMHTVNAKGEVLRYAPRSNNWFQKAGNVLPRLRGIDTSGAFSDSLAMRGTSAEVAERARGLTNAVEKIENLRRANAPEEAVESARAAAYAKNVEFDQIRLQEASKSLLHLEKMQEIEQAALDKLPDGAKKAAQEARVKQVNGLVEAQRKHVIKLNVDNAELVAKHLSDAQNVNGVAERIMKKPHLFQRIVSFFNPNGAKNIQLFNELQSYGFNQDQLKAIQQAVESNNIEAVKKALTKAANHSDEVATGIFQAAGTPTTPTTTTTTPTTPTTTTTTTPPLWIHAQ
jgi:hypothetical protein